MLGLIVVVVAAVYLALVVWTMRAAYRWAKNRGWSRGRCWAAAGGGFLAVYLPVFWDHVPTLLAHRYYCEKEAGFWVYKSVEQWNAENPGVAETLKYRNMPERIRPDGTSENILNERFSRLKKKTYVKFLSTNIREEQLIDRKTGEILARHVTVGSGYGSWMAGGDWRQMKSWLSLGVCDPAARESERFESGIFKMGRTR